MTVRHERRVKRERERKPKDATNLKFIIKLLSQHVSAIIMLIFGRTRLCTAACGVLHCNKRGKPVGCESRSVFVWSNGL